MQWPLGRLARLQLHTILTPFVLWVGQQRRWPEQRGRVQPQHKATLVASRFVSVLHA
jgi:hypothetical protein